MEKIYLTKDGIVKLQSELQILIDKARVTCAKSIQDALDIGGYEDNLSYDASLAEQARVENRILEIEDLLRRVVVIDEEIRTPVLHFVRIGSTVTVEVDGEKDRFMIVGYLEANPAAGKISNESPVGQALLGAKVGDVVEVSTPIVKVVYKVLDIKYE